MTMTAAEIFETLAGPVLHTAAINENVAPDDFTDASSLWEDIGTVAIQGSSLVVQLTNVGAETWVLADAIRIERIGAVPAAPEIAVSRPAAAPSAPPRPGSDVIAAGLPPAGLSSTCGSPVSGRSCRVVGSPVRPG